MAKFAVIMPAAGASRRFRDKHYKKPFAVLDGRAVWLHSAEKFLSRDDVVQLILLVAEQDREEFNMKFAANVAIMGVDVVEGGAERADSVERALGRVKPEVDFVAVHDAARPCLAEEWIEKIFDEAQKSGAAIFAVPVAGTLKRVSHNTIDETVSREHLWEAQTPQVFRRQLLLDAYAKRDGFVATDDAQLVERLGEAVAIVPGSSLNLKITTKDDLRLAQQVLKVLPKPKPGGTGNPFAEDDIWR
ncbi:MAG: 2-C-methyl-D-erythritol 4-phosphate cytidylyltransferase [Planctomycetota bacterium]|nr:MAG: 2-C-methyl-D-erythritol 4-phosphate cytidylyltransferase [Planctomycetota bacterium]REK48453.1 MAG: 2-C-methyl-D-erythritol 4-phosphate cytidylyltransferase [Planctomycetota bacterium]